MALRLKTGRYVGVGNLILIGMFLMVYQTSAVAAIFDVTVTDVTTRAFSVVWVANAPLTHATVKVFRNANGTEEITSTLSVNLVSRAFPPAMVRGIAKVQVTGLEADTQVFIQTESRGTGEKMHFPPRPPFLPVRTAAKTTKATPQQAPIVNDLIMHPLFLPDGVTAAGALLLVHAPALSATPLTAFAGEGLPLRAFQSNDFSMIGRSPNKPG